MANSLVGWRAQLVFALCLPVAVLIGYTLADPTDLSSIGVMLLVLGALSVPLLMYSYHLLLVFTWNAALMPYFLPGQPFLWMLVAFLGFGFAIVNRFTSRQARFLSVPSISRPMLVLLLIALGTAVYRGGLGFRIFGSGQYGGKGYFFVTAAVVGYFALISQRIPRRRAGLIVGLFFLSGLTSLVPNLAYLGGRSFYFLFYLFPLTYAQEQVASDFDTTMDYGRILGMTYGAIALYCWLFARYGLRGMFDLKRPVRLVFFMAATVACFYSGYRGFFLLFLLTVAAQFCAERLLNLRNAFILGLFAVVGGAIVFPNVDKLPLVVQRSLSFLPLKNMDQGVRISADGSSQWRLQMWGEVIPEIPKYLLVGKGYGVDPLALDLAADSRQRGSGTESQYAWAVVTGNYHSGPLTLLIPFGLWGFAAFLWLVYASLRYLYRSYLYGDAELKNINTFLLAYFIARLLYYMLIFGNFYTDFFQFAGIVALSISLNGSESRVAEVSRERAIDLQPEEYGLSSAQGHEA